jgi:hypothetical protein
MGERGEGGRTTAGRASIAIGGYEERGAGIQKAGDVIKRDMDNKILFIPSACQ